MSKSPQFNQQAEPMYLPKPENWPFMSKSAGAMQ